MLKTREFWVGLLIGVGLIGLGAVTFPPYAPQAPSRAVVCPDPAPCPEPVAAPVEAPDKTWVDALGCEDCPCPEPTPCPRLSNDFDWCELCPEQEPVVIHHEYQGKANCCPVCQPDGCD